MPGVRPDRLELLNFFRMVPNTQFVIPVYQRNYIWVAKKQVKKFLEDYKAVLSQERDRHFIGIIMYLQIQRRIGFNEFSVVDGQQRLVTTFLMLYALKSIAIDSGNESFAKQINDIYLTNQYAEEDNDKLKLKPLVSDDDAFSKIINDDISSLSKEEKKSNVYLNYVAIKKYLKDLFGHFQLEQMLGAFDKFYFVAIPLDGNEDDAQKIFETINSAGAALSKSDLIRNYILMNVESNEQDRLYKNYWYPMEKSFASSGKIENFFRMFLANRNYNLCSLEEVYDSFQVWFDKNKSNYGIEESLRIICKYAKYYNDIFVNEDVHISSEVDSALKEFRHNTIEPTAPLLMEIYNLYCSKDELHEHLVSSSDFAKIINLFNTYNVRRNIVNQRTGILTRIIPLMLKSVLEWCDGVYGDIYNHCVRYLVDNSKGKQSFMPDDEYLKTNLLGANAYSLRNYVKTVFEKIESHNNPAVVNFDNLTIEHLMPQTPTKEWLDALHITGEEYEYNLHRLGNLTLAASSDNSRMSNSPFEYKRDVLRSTAHLKMNIEIIEKEEWGVKEINERTVQLIEKICELYPYVSAGAQVIKHYNIFLHEDNAEVVAHIFGDETVEIQEGSVVQLVFNNSIRELIEEGVLKENGQKYEFIQTHLFTSLEEATSFLLPDNAVNCWELWQDRNRKSLNSELRAKLANRQF